MFNYLDEEDRNRVGKDPKEKMKLINFYPENKNMMWAPCIWDQWTSENGELSFQSFAIITSEPPDEVRMMGHDRCPIFLKQSLIDDWLEIKGNHSQMINLLRKHEENKFLYRWG